MRELQEQWTYDDVMRASAVLDMYSAWETARDAYDKAELDGKRKEIEKNAGR